MGNSFSELEGVVKYHLDHRHAELEADIDISELNAWRSLFYRLGLIGRVAEKYQGLGFGNISQRRVPNKLEFLISGTQTGHLPRLRKQDFALIEAASPTQNSIHSRGLSEPSSEALTHASVYQQHASIAAVIHVHCEELWRLTKPLGLAFTDAEIPYGTTAMAAAVTELFVSGHLKTAGLFSMLGHEDGIVAFGETLSEASFLLINALAKAIAIEQSPLQL